jgi:aspartate racemase
VDDLVAQGVQVIVLGCTELPLLLRGSTLKRPDGLVVQLVDPTEVLAKRCVAYALGGSGVVQAASEPAEPVMGRFNVESVFG